RPQLRAAATRRSALPVAGMQVPGSHLPLVGPPPVTGGVGDRDVKHPTEVPVDPVVPSVPALLGRPSQGDGTCRGGYGIPVVERYGSACAYCGRDLAESYEAWLNLSVDHVVPRNAIAVGVPEEWIEDLLNHVTCCRVCNEF